LPAASDERLKQRGRSEGVCPNVTFDLVHRLADTNLRSLMKNYFYTVERGIDRAPIANVSPYDFDIRGQFASRGFVHLFDKCIQHANPFASPEQFRDEVRSDEPGTASY
jgi:hypothetical protein